jgi:hypothetical protein
MTVSLVCTRAEQRRHRVLAYSYKGWNISVRSWAMSFVGQCLLLGYLLQKVRHASLLNDNALEGENIVVFAIGMLHNGGMNCTSGIMLRIAFDLLRRMLRKNFRASFICDTASKFIDKSLQSGVREFFLENIAAA